MVDYKCLRCDYQTTHKGSLVNHLKRKNICPPKNGDISIEYIINFYGFKLKNDEKKSTPNHSKITPNHSKTDFTPNHSKSLQTYNFSLQNNSKSLHSKHRCLYCNRDYSRKDNLTKHLKICREKKTRRK